MNPTTNKYGTTTSEIVNRRLNYNNKQTKTKSPMKKTIYKNYEITKKQEKDQFVKEQEMNTTNNMIANLKNDLENLNQDIHNKKKENLELIEYFQSEMENMNKENEKLNQSQEEQLENYNKNINEYHRILQFLENGIEQTEKAIIEKDREIQLIKDKFEDLNERKRNHFDNLLNLYLTYENELKNKKEAYYNHKAKLNIKVDE